MIVAGCNDCHTEEGETAAWAAAKVREWYPAQQTERTDFAQAFASASQGQPQAETMLAEVADVTFVLTPPRMATQALFLLDACDERRCLGGGGETLVVENLTPGSRYSFRVSGEGADGPIWSKPTRFNTAGATARR